MRFFPIGLLLLAAVGCNKDVTETEAAAERTVIVEANAFAPNSVTIRQGGTVNFVFQGVAHNVIFTEKPGRPENIEIAIANTTEERVFNTAGTFPFECSQHATTMNGIVNVQPVP